MMSRNVMLSAFCFWRKERIINMYTKIGIPENNSLKARLKNYMSGVTSGTMMMSLEKHILMNQ